MNKGIWYGIGAYVTWGLFPIYWKWLHNVPALQLIGHRILWSFVLLVAFVLVSRQWKVFRVAALDMELRGAGNLLGGQQHGHVNAIGLELYCQILEGAVRELRGEPARPEFTTTINLGLDIRIPSSYIPEEHQRLRMYKQIGGTRSAAERDNAEQELNDRYGPLPRSVKNLLEYAGLKLRAERLWIRSIERKKDTLEVQFHAETKVEPAQLMEFIAAHPGAQFTPAGVLRLPLRGDSKDPLPRLEALLAQLER